MYYYCYDYYGSRENRAVRWLTFIPLIPFSSPRCAFMTFRLKANPSQVCVSVKPRHLRRTSERRRPRRTEPINIRENPPRGLWLNGRNNNNRFSMTSCTFYYRPLWSPRAITPGVIKHQSHSLQWETASKHKLPV